MYQNNAVAVQNNNSIQSYLEKPKVLERIQSRINTNPNDFVSNLLALVNDNKQLEKCTPQSIVLCAINASSIGLPITKQLGLAYIVPYKDVATLQIGYKGFIQLALRTKKFRHIGVCAVYQGDTDASLLHRLTGLAPMPLPSEVKIGYVARFELLDGFYASQYMSLEAIQQHRDKYGKRNPLWNSEFEAMAEKTVLKSLLSQKAPLFFDDSIIQALDEDNAAVVKDVHTGVQDPNVGVSPFKMQVTDEQFRNNILPLTSTVSKENILNRYELTQHQLIALEGMYPQYNQPIVYDATTGNIENGTYQQQPVNQYQQYHDPNQNYGYQG